MRSWRVFGPPGTGKTTYLTRQAERAAKRYGGGAVLVASLTRAAAAEVAGRNSSIPAENVGTLHAHAFRLLDRPAVADVPEGLREWNEWIGRKQPTLVIQAGLALRPDEAPMEWHGYDSDGDEMLGTMNIYRARQVPREMWPTRVRRFAARWDEWKEQAGRIDFTEMIERCVESEPFPPYAPEVLMLDEAQDFSRLEMALALKWGESCREMVIVGDPDQNLYTWRGSDARAFTSWEADGEIVLEQSYRVPGAVHRLATRWITMLEDRRPVEYRPRDEEGLVRQDPFTWADPEPLLNRLIRDEREGRSAMVLASCGYMLKPLIVALRRQGIPFHNPYRRSQGAWNPLRYADRVLAFMRPRKDTWESEARLWTWPEVAKWIEPLRAKGVLKIGAKSFVKARAENDRFGDRAKEPIDLGTLLELFEDEHHEPLFDADPGWWFGHLLGTQRDRFDYQRSVLRSRGARALIEDPKVIVGTIHSVKGGEADSVYIWPDLSPQGYWEGWMTRGEGKAAIVRQFYVAMTRARHTLTLLASDGQAVDWPSIKEA